MFSLDVQNNYREILQNARTANKELQKTVIGQDNKTLTLAMTIQNNLLDLQNLLLLDAVILMTNHLNDKE